MNYLFPSSSMLLLKKPAREAFCQMSHKRGLLGIWHWELVIQAGGITRAEHLGPLGEESK